MKEKIKYLFFCVIFFVLLSIWLTIMAGVANIAEYTNKYDEYFGVFIYYAAYWPSILSHIVQKEGLSSTISMKVNHIGWSVIGLLVYLLLTRARENYKERVFSIIQKLPLFIIGVILGTVIWYFRNLNS
ncbi:MAG: hypothetical protein U9R52_02900, partial [Candidatus Omnitrophota bacterium]|nr:hypothetical protein [Candidatus Omnitrophota bacterium]